MGLEITAEHVKELATAFGDNVLVPMPCEHPPAGDLWVIDTANKHYDGWATVYATSEQVTDLAVETDYDEDGELTDEAAERIARKLNEPPREEAQGYARSAGHPDGYTARVMAEVTAPRPAVTYDVPDVKPDEETGLSTWAYFANGKMIGRVEETQHGYVPVRTDSLGVETWRKPEVAFRASALDLIREHYETTNGLPRS
jgi:hypothetical protein